MIQEIDVEHPNSGAFRLLLPVVSTSKVKETTKIENLQKSYTKKIPQSKNMNYWERLSSLKMTSQQRRYERY